MRLAAAVCTFLLTLLIGKSALADAPTDAASVSASIASKSTVQLQSAASGLAPQDSSALCLIQASP